MNIKKAAGILFLFLYAILCLSLSLTTNSFNFFISCIFYCSIVGFVSYCVKSNKKLKFFQVVTFFLLVYTIYATAVHFVFIEDPFSDAYVNIDAHLFFSYAVNLSKLSYKEIWHTAFTQFKYSGSPLFYAWIGTLQKITDLNFYYSLLFQKLNVAFLGSFIPGVVYLLCNRITDKRSAFKAAIVYGLFSFTFFYSVGLMRDIHVALVYAIGLYIIVGNKYNLNNYVILCILGIIAYFLRFENGLFFLIFIGVWMLRTNSDNKLFFALVTVASLTVVIIVLGGVNTIYNMAIKTIQNYSERAVRLADQDSLGVQLMRMPIPINWIGMTAFGQLSPFPFWVVFRDDISVLKNIFYLPQVIAVFFWFSVWMRIIQYPRRATDFYRKYKYVVSAVILYLVLVSIALPGPRRLMAVYPVVFMAYIYISKNIFKAKELLINAFVYSLLLIIYFFLKI